MVALWSGIYYLLGQLEEGIIALSGESVVAAVGRRHVGYAAVPVQGSHPGVDQPAGQPARCERSSR